MRAEVELLVRNNVALYRQCENKGVSERDLAARLDVMQDEK